MPGKHPPHLLATTSLKQQKIGVQCSRDEDGNPKTINVVYEEFQHRGLSIPLLEKLAPLVSRLYADAKTLPAFLAQMSLREILNKGEEGSEPSPDDGDSNP